MKVLNRFMHLSREKLNKIRKVTLWVMLIVFRGIVYLLNRSLLLLLKLSRTSVGPEIFRFSTEFFHDCGNVGDGTGWGVSRKGFIACTGRWKIPRKQNRGQYKTTTVEWGRLFSGKCVRNERKTRPRVREPLLFILMAVGRGKLRVFRGKTWAFASFACFNRIIVV